MEEKKDDILTHISFADNDEKAIELKQSVVGTILNARRSLQVFMCPPKGFRLWAEICREGVPILVRPRIPACNEAN